MNHNINSVDEAIAILLKGGVGVLPTDTVYGLVARAADQAAVSRLYALKHRENKPGTVIAASVEQLVELGIPKRYLSAGEKLWPNPLSIEIPLGRRLTYLHQDTGRQAYRVVADDVVQAILKQTGPLLTSSANQPGEPGATDLQQAIDYFNNEVDFYVDGGDLSGKAPSTIIRIIDDAIEIIRPGAVVINEEGRITSKQGCVFCLSNKKLDGEVLAKNASAFLIEASTNVGNFLIVPTEHIEHPTELPDTWWHELKHLLTKVPNLTTDYNIALNYGKQAGQKVKHLHFWVVPRHDEQAASGKGLARLINEANE